jgi:hypothetical protein
MGGIVNVIQELKSKKNESVRKNNKMRGKFRIRFNNQKIFHENRNIAFPQGSML